MNFDSARLRTVVLFNATAIAIFLLLGSRYWMTEDAALDVPMSQLDAGMGWELCAVLIIFVAVGGNLGLLIRSIRTRSHDREAWLVVLFGMSIVCWTAAFLFDSAHNGARVLG